MTKNFRLAKGCKAMEMSVDNGVAFAALVEEQSRIICEQSVEIRELRAQVFELRKMRDSLEQEVAMLSGEIDPLEDNYWFSK